MLPNVRIPPTSTSLTTGQLVRAVVADVLGLEVPQVSGETALGKGASSIAKILCVKLDKAVIVTPETTITELTAQLA